MANTRNIKSGNGGRAARDREHLLRARVGGELYGCVEEDAKSEDLTQSDIVRRILRLYYRGQGRIAA